MIASHTAPMVAVAGCANHCSVLLSGYLNCYSTLGAISAGDGKYYRPLVLIFAGGVNRYCIVPVVLYGGRKP